MYFFVIFVLNKNIKVDWSEISIIINCFSAWIGIASRKTSLVQFKIIANLTDRGRFHGQKDDCISMMMMVMMIKWWWWCWVLNQNKGCHFFYTYSFWGLKIRYGLLAKDGENVTIIYLPMMNDYKTKCQKKLSAWYFNWKSDKLATSKWGQLGFG